MPLTILTGVDLDEALLPPNRRCFLLFYFRLAEAALLGCKSSKPAFLEKE
jgi:hypothetical protein